MKKINCKKIGYQVTWKSPKKIKVNQFVMYNLANFEQQQTQTLNKFNNSIITKKINFQSLNSNKKIIQQKSPASKIPQKKVVKKKVKKNKIILKKLRKQNKLKYQNISQSKKLKIKLNQYNSQVRLKNYNTFSRRSNLSQRFPWGCNQQYINNYCYNSIQNMAKDQKNFCKQQELQFLLEQNKEGQKLKRKRIVSNSKSLKKNKRLKRCRSQQIQRQKGEIEEIKNICQQRVTNEKNKDKNKDEDDLLSPKYKQRKIMKNKKMMRQKKNKQNLQFIKKVTFIQKYWKKKLIQIQHRKLFSIIKKKKSFSKNIQVQSIQSYFLQQQITNNQHLQQKKTQNFFETTDHKKIFIQKIIDSKISSKNFQQKLTESEQQQQKNQKIYLKHINNTLNKKIEFQQQQQIIQEVKSKVFDKINQEKNNYCNNLQKLENTNDFNKILAEFKESAQIIQNNIQTFERKETKKIIQKQTNMLFIQNRISEMLQKQFVYQKPKGIPTNLHVINQYLICLSKFIKLYFKQQFIQNMNKIIGPNISQRLKMMRHNQYIQNQQNQQETYSHYVLVQDFFTQFQQHVIQTPQNASPQEQFNKQLQHIHNKCVFDCFNQALNYSRSLYQSQRFYFKSLFPVEQIPNKINYNAKQHVLDWGSKLCGLIIDDFIDNFSRKNKRKFLKNVTEIQQILQIPPNQNQYITKVRNQRVILATYKQIKQKTRDWQVYEQWILQLLLQITQFIQEQIISQLFIDFIK